MKIHSREANVHAAQHVLLTAIIEMNRTCDLTPGEGIRVVSEILYSELSSIAKYMIREERHPGKPDMPGGLE